MAFKPKGKLIDMFTGNAMDVSMQDTKANDTRANEAGSVYLGVLPNETAEHLRSRGQQLQARQEQLAHLVTAWEQDHTHYLVQLQSVFMNLGMVKNGESFSSKEVIIDKNGHVYLYKPGTILH